MSQLTTQNRIRLILLDDQVLFRTSLGRFLAAQPDLEVAGECATTSEALEMLRASKVDIVLLDFNRIGEVGNSFVSAARRAGYQGRFLILAGAVDSRQSAAAIQLGASGIFLKLEPPARLVQAIQLVVAGAVWLDQTVVRLLADRSFDRLPHLDGRKAVICLTDRERNVLLGVLKGLTNRKIGDNLGLSEGSVKASVQQLFSKTGVRRRSQLVRVALERSLTSAAAETAGESQSGRGWESAP